MKIAIAGIQKIKQLFAIFLGLSIYLLLVNKSILNDIFKDNKKVKENIPGEPEKKDWHDHDAIKAALARTGIGEAEQPALISREEYIKNEVAINESFYNFGINGYLSDKISVNRSVPDYRHEKCKSTKYLSNLPKASIIIPFKDECLSVLIRTLHSITNRTPPELLEEIILIDDNSTLKNLKAPLQKYVEEFFPKVKLIRLLEPHGIMQARVVGAKKAISKILVVLDAHIEVGYNWLPPLIEPIVFNYKTCTLPHVDSIVGDTLEFESLPTFRGGFDYAFLYYKLPLLSPNDDKMQRLNPVMLGGLFAIATEFFWELGGYDSELQVWGGEQYELSFKIWMCGGNLLDIPCSRIGHAGQLSLPIRYRAANNSAVYRNYMRIAEVWMDDYKKYIYQNIPEMYKNVDIGDISGPKAVRENLQCNSFEWYLKNIAFDSVRRLLVDDPASYAGGAIQSLRFPERCVEIIFNQPDLGYCNNGSTEQTWLFTERSEIRKKGQNVCLETNLKKRQAYLADCHGRGGMQKWLYSKEKKIIIHPATKRCLLPAPKESILFLYKCHSKKLQLQWELSWFNETMKV